MNELNDEILFECIKLKAYLIFLLPVQIFLYE